MGERVLDWSEKHPDPTPGYAAAVSRLRQLVSRENELAAQQRDGLLEVRRATARKRTLRGEILQVHLPHVISAAVLASEEEPELAEKFQLPGRVTTYAAFRTAARGVLGEAESRKELLTQHGLSEAVLEALRKLLDEFDEVVERGAQGRALHVGASAELENSAGELVRVVNVLDGINRFRFVRGGELFSAWEAMRNVLAASTREKEEPTVPAAPKSTGDTPPGQSQSAA